MRLARRWNRWASSGGDAEVAQLRPGLGPGQGRGALEGRRVAVLVGEVERRLARRRHQGGEGDAGRARPAARRTVRRRLKIGSSTAPAVFDSGPAVEHRRRVRTPRPRPRKRARSVSYCGARRRCSPVDRRRRGPPTAGGSSGERGRRVASSAPEPGHALGLDEQVGEGRVGEVGGRRGEHDLGVGGQLDLAASASPWLVSETRRTSASSSGETTTSSGVAIVAVAADDLGPVLGEGDLVAVGLDAASAGSRPTRPRRSRASRRKT